MKRKEFFAKWIEALESGKYKQARYSLRKLRNQRKGTFGYCCLGVACEISNTTKYVKVNIANQQEINEALPEKLARRLGITDSGKFIDAVKYRGRWYSSLIALNDDAKASFKTIAKIIRKQLETKNFSKN